MSLRGENLRADPFFFGYGSLVHKGTHDYPDAAHARLSGWRREWCATTLRDVAFLSVKPCDKTEIDGLVARVPGSDWAALDVRERAYDRHDIKAQIRSRQRAPSEIQVYAVARQNRSNDSRPSLLLSYIDVVVQGYLREFGVEGVERFFSSTDGWDAKVINDRSAPIYPRHQKLSIEEQALVDDYLNRYGATFHAGANGV